MDDQTIRHTLIHMGIKKRKPQMRPSTSVLPAIETPHPGTSYNPSYEDHQSLLQEVAEKEEKLLKEEKHLDRVTTKMFARLSGADKTTRYLEEMSEGLDISTNKSKNDTNNNNNTTNTEESSEPGCIGKPVVNAKKTKSQRRKQREQKLLKLSLSTKKTDKKKTSDIYRLKQIGKQIEKAEKTQAMMREKREKKKELDVAEPKQLGKRKFEKPDKDFLMAAELSGNLRNLGAIGNPLKDRFLRMQERNVLAPSVMRTIERAKVKRFTKPDHKIEPSKLNK